MCFDEYAPESPGLLSNPKIFRKTFFAGLLGSAVIGILLSIIWGQNDVPKIPAKKQITESQKSPASNRPLVVKSFKYTKSDEYGLNTLLEADLLEVRPRRFMAFNAKSVNEAFLSNAHVVLHTYEHKEPAAELLDFFNYECPPPCVKNSKADSARIQPLGRVTRLITDKIKIDLYRDDQQIVALDAASGLIDKKKDDLKFFNATLMDLRSNRTIRAGSIKWDRKGKVFVIPGRYRESGPNGEVTGTSIMVDLEFTVTPMVAAAKLPHH